MVKVSVHLITYNHEKFVAQAIESALMQETNFAYEIVVSDDCSRDRTPEIIADYARRYPDRIRPILRERNLGMNANFAETYYACNGMYVAFLEGDDYWTSPHKLQRQADFLDAHPQHVLCAHTVTVVHEGSDAPSFVTRSDPRGDATLADVIAYRYPLPTCGMMLRKSALDRFPPWFYEIFNCDYATQMLAARNGPIRYMDEPMGVYRKHGGGVTSLPSDYQMDRMIRLFHSLDAELDYAYHGMFLARVASCYRSKTKILLMRRRLVDAVRSAMQYARYAVTSAVARERTS